MKSIFVAYSPNSELEKVPIMKTMINCIDSIYVQRGKDEEGRKKAME